MLPRDTDWIHLWVVFDLIIFDPGCKSFDVIPGNIQAVGPGIQSHEVIHHLDCIVQRVNLILGSQSPADITGAIIQDVIMDSGSSPE